MRLDICESTSEKLGNPFDRKGFHDIDMLAAAVIAPSRQALGVLAIVILLITFVPVPFAEVPASASFAFETAAAPHTSIASMNWTIPPAGQDTISFNVNNTGNVHATVRLEIRPQNLDRINWTLRIVDFTVYGDGPPQSVSVNSTSAFIPLNVTEYATVRILVGVPASSMTGTFTFSVRGDITEPGNSTPVFALDLDVNITVP